MNTVKNDVIDVARNNGMDIARNDVMDVVKGGGGGQRYKKAYRAHTSPCI